jgi:uncharacterized integral membrane protein
MKLLYWILVAFVATVLALFAASNREIVTLALWPLPFVVELPLYLASLAGVLTGFLAGLLAAWIGGRSRRREARRRGNRIAALERELAAVQARQAEAAENAPARLAMRG